MSSAVLRQAALAGILVGLAASTLACSPASTVTSSPAFSIPPTATPEPPTLLPSPAGVRLSLVATYRPTDIPGLDVLGYLDVGPDGNLYIPNAGSSEIIVLGPDGTVVRRWGAPGTEAGEFGFLRDAQDPDSALGGIALAADGTSYVVEAGNKRVQRFGPTGEPEVIWGSQGSGEGQFADPIGVAVSMAGEVFVVDDERDIIQVFTDDGNYLRTIGAPGSGDGELLFTGNIRLRSDGVLVNADFGNSRVQAWNAAGDFMWSLGELGTDPGQFTEPQDVAFGPDGTLFVVDDTRVQVFNAAGEVVAVRPDEPSTEHLASIALNGDTLWVVAPYVDMLFEVRVDWGS